AHSRNARGEMFRRHPAGPAAGGGRGARRLRRGGMSPRPASPLDLSLPDGGGRRVLVTGASGYVGGRLVPELVAAGFTVRAGARDPRKLEDRPWAKDVELVTADLEDAEQVGAAMAEVHTVLYLVHSMGGGGDFVEREAQIARTVAEAAAAQGVQQIVYL